MGIVSQLCTSCTHLFPNSTTPEIPEYVRQQAANLVCSRCGVIGETTLSWSPRNNAWRADCSACDAYIKFVSSKTPDEREAARQRGLEQWMAQQPPTERQMTYLRKCGAASRPTTMLEASRLIAVLARAGGEAS